MTDMADDLAEFLRGQPPFDGLDADERGALAATAQQRSYAPGAVVLDAFREPSAEVFVVVSGQVDVWTDADLAGQPADERLGPGGIFGFSAMLTERSVGPRAVAVDDTVVAALPAAAVEPVFASREGARFLAAHLSARDARPAAHPGYSLVDELIVAPPLVLGADDTVAEVARAMTDRALSYAAVELGPEVYGLVTDAVLRQRVLVDGVPTTAPARAVAVAAPAVHLGDSAAEVLITLLDRDAEFLLVTDRAGVLRGVVGPRDFVVSPTTAGVSLHEQLRRAATLEELQHRARQVRPMLSDLLFRSLASGRVIAVYSAIIDTVVRRALGLVFAEHPELSLDAFTWLSLGSNGRREAVLSSDVDAAVAFDDQVGEAEAERYRAVFAEVDEVLAECGLSTDPHGATPRRAPFARTNAAWRAAARRWLAAPEQEQGAIMTSLLVDGRPIHGDPGLPAVTQVFAEVRRHPGTMRLLLQESLSRRAKLHSVWEVLSRRADTFDVKAHAVLPVVNLARWAALSVGSAVLPTTERLHAAGGSAMLPEQSAEDLVEVFETLQRLRLRYQLLQHQRGERPADLLTLDRLSPIDRTVVVQAVREIAAVQRRMDNIALYVPAEGWTAPEQS